MPGWIVGIGVIASLFGSISYIKGIFQATVKPNQVSWFFWAIAPISGATIAWLHGAGFWLGLPLFMSGFVPLLVLISSFIQKKTKWQWQRIDYICAILATAAIIFWLLTDQPGLAVVFLILTDLCAAIPTLIKSWQEPRSESPIVFLSGLVGPVLGLITNQNFTFITSGFLVYIVLINSLLPIIIIGRGHLDKKA